jgi:DNA end-binding protein Ku
VKRKAAGKPIEAPEEKEGESNVVDLMDALKQSLGRKKVTTSSARSKNHVPAHRSQKRKAA